jgi:hypothetical protein
MATRTQIEETYNYMDELFRLTYAFWSIRQARSASVVHAHQGLASSPIPRENPNQNAHPRSLQTIARPRPAPPPGRPHRQTNHSRLQLEGRRLEDKEAEEASIALSYPLSGSSLSIAGASPRRPKTYPSLCGG